MDACPAKAMLCTGVTPKPPTCWETGFGPESSRLKRFLGCVAGASLQATESFGQFFTGQRRPSFLTSVHLDIPMGFGGLLDSHT